MKKQTPPALWLITIIVGLPLFSENLYSPSLPNIAAALKAPDAWVEYTLTLYLFGFAFGTFIWGKLSDQYGRKTTLIAGFIIYLIGALGCCLSNHIYTLLCWRFVQAFGGSAGSVLGRTITQESFPLAIRGHVFSTISIAISLSPAIAPFIGGLLSQTFQWKANFYFLLFLGLITIISIYWKLPETLDKTRRTKVAMGKFFWVVIKDVRFLSLSFFIAGVNGIGFSYFAEGSFYLIELLGLSPATFGATFIALACGYMVGAFLSRFLHKTYTTEKILSIGIRWVLFMSILYPLLTFVGIASTMPPIYYIAVTIGYICIAATGMSLIIPNALALSIEAYPNTAGTASSLFGGFYYVVAALFSFGMGWLHNDTLIPMPCYFFFIALCMWCVYRYIFRSTTQKNKAY